MTNPTNDPGQPLTFSSRWERNWPVEYPDAYQLGRERAIEHDGQTWRCANPYIGGTGDWHAWNIGWNSVTRRMK